MMRQASNSQGSGLYYEPDRQISFDLDRGLAHDCEKLAGNNATRAKNVCLDDDAVPTPGPKFWTGLKLAVLIGLGLWMAIGAVIIRLG